MSYDLKVLEQGCEELGIALNDTQKQQFIAFYEYLAEKNKVMNLTGITEFQEVLVKHFLDSLACVKAVDMTKVSKIMDIGTGAGFPGIPLKIVYPELEVVLLDSLNKRLKFLNNVIDELGLKNITTVHGRAEDIAHMDEYREKFSLCVSRAVANLSTLSEYCIPFINESGIFISYKSEFSEEETDNAKKAIKVLGGKIEDTYIEELPHSDINRSFVVIKKERSTSNKYPRKAGVPSKKPIR